MVCIKKECKIRFFGCNGGISYYSFHYGVVDGTHEDIESFVPPIDFRRFMPDFHWAFLLVLPVSLCLLHCFFHYFSSASSFLINTKPYCRLNDAAASLPMGLKFLISV